jgi:hypothetical protein
MRYLVLVLALAIVGVSGAGAQEATRWKSAVVALTDDPALRAEFETGLVELARQNNYDAVTSFDIEPDVRGLDDRGFVDELNEQGVQAVLMVRPAAIGEGSSIEAVREQISPDVYGRIREFAGEVSSSGMNDLLAVVHLAIYTIDDAGAHLISGGAVWLDEPVENQNEGIERLQELILYNVNAVRPAIRRHFGLPPLE